MTIKKSLNTALGIEDHLNNELEKEIAKGATQLQAKMRLTFKTPLGIETLTRILNRCSIFGLRESADPINAGMRAVGIGIMQDLGILDPASDNPMIDQGIVAALMNITPKGGSTE